MAQIICKNVSVGYSGRAVLNGVDFCVNSGDYLFIVGENGSGKSTLMKTILGLQPLVSGEIIFGNDVSANSIGYLPQHTEVQRDFPASVKEIVMSGFQGQRGMRPFYSRKQKQTAAENMKKMNISTLSSHSYRELSGGQQQRVLLARTLCAAQQLLMLDEPVSGLDPDAAEEMYKTVYDLNKNDNMTVITISHDINAAKKYASHILHIKENIFFGTNEEYIKNGGFSNIDINNAVGKGGEANE